MDRFLSVLSSAPTLSWIPTALEVLRTKTRTGSVFGGAHRAQPVDLHGKVALVTGGSSGIGKETVCGLVRMGATVILACRSATRTLPVMQEICARVSCAAERLKFVELDLASLQSVRLCVQQMKEMGVHLDILINNAGLTVAPGTKTVDGLEMNVGVNHLGHFLFTLLLLREGLLVPTARIVVLSSAAAAFMPIDFTDIEAAQQPATPLGTMRSYGVSKLMNAMFAIELNERLSAAGLSIRCDAVHPGAVETNLGHEDPMRARFSFLTRFFFKDPELGAQTSLHVATAPLPGRGGLYFEECAESRCPGPQAYDPEARRRLWTESARLVGEPGFDEAAFFVRLAEHYAGGDSRAAASAAAAAAAASPSSLLVAARRELVDAGAGAAAAAATIDRGDVQSADIELTV